MPTWEIRITRKSVQQRGKRVRTVGSYQIYHDGVAATAEYFHSGTTAESRGPGANSPKSNGKCIENGTYPLWTQDGDHYKTIKYIVSDNSKKTPKPGILLEKTNKRTGILIHPGVGFLASIGCINLCTSLPDASESIDFPKSRDRVIAVINDMKDVLGAGFPHSDGHEIVGASAVFSGDPWH